MALEPSCPHCPTPLTSTGDRWSCPAHGAGQVLWRPREPSYDDLAAHLELAAPLPTGLPWPMAPGWRVTDFAVLREDGTALATLGCTTGTSRHDGPVDLLVIVERAGAGLGSRVAGLPGSDPGPELGQGPAAARVRFANVSVPLWALSTSRADPEFDRAVLVGVLGAYWLWVVVRPAPALLLFGEEQNLCDAADLGPLLVEVPVEGPAPRW